MEKHVAVRADFPDAPYIEQAGLWSGAMQRAHFVWCQTAPWSRGMGGGSFGFRREQIPSTDATSRSLRSLSSKCLLVWIFPHRRGGGISPCWLCVDVYRTRQFIKNASYVVSRQADVREMTTEI